MARRKRLLEEQAEDRRLRLERIATLEDPTERLLSAVRFVLNDFDPANCSVGPKEHNLYASVVVPKQRDDLARTCPDFCADLEDSQRTRKGSWDSQEVGAWFAQRMTERYPVWRGPKKWEYPLPEKYSWVERVFFGKRVRAAQVLDRERQLDDQQLTLGDLDEMAEKLGLPREVKILKSLPA